MPIMLSIIDSQYRKILPLISNTSPFHVDNVNIQFSQTYVSNKYVMRNHASNASNLTF